MTLNYLIHVLNWPLADDNEIIMCRIIKSIKIQKLEVQFYQLMLKLVSYIDYIRSGLEASSIFPRNCMSKINFIIN
jgi:hypothetical protein